MLLLIRPGRDEVRLPKGHIEAEETSSPQHSEKCAKRPGMTIWNSWLTFGEQLVTFLLGDRTIRRVERYFLMPSPDQIQRPSPDEQQFFVVWVELDEAVECLTFEAEKEWIRRASAAWRWDMETNPNGTSSKCCGTGTREKALEIHRRLLAIYGEQRPDPTMDNDPVAMLVNTILSQNTNDRNRDIAYQQLRQRFPDLGGRP